jgi:tetratricopeptide (TPR) repeat protein
VLSAWAEQAWEQIRGQLDLRSGLWTGWVFSDDRTVFSELLRRSGEHTRGLAVQTMHRELSGDDDVTGVPEWLLGLVGLTETPLAAVWLTDPGGRDTPGHRAAWSQALVRLEETRDLLREALPCGILIGVPPWLLSLVRDLAPGLWTLRAVVASAEGDGGAGGVGESSVQPSSARPAAGTGPGRATGEAVPVLDEDNEALRDWQSVLTLELALADAVEPSAELVDQVTQAVADQPEGPGTRLAETVVTGMERARDATDRAWCYAWLAQLRSRQGDLVAAQDLAARALGCGRPLGPEMTADLLYLVAAGGSPSAVPASRLCLELSRAQLSAAGESPEEAHEALGRLWSDLMNAARCDAEQSVPHLEEALTVARTLYREHGSSLDHLEDVAKTAAELAYALVYQACEPDRAHEFATESVRLARELVVRSGDDDEGRKLLGSHLWTLARVEEARQRPEAALRAYGEAFEVKYALFERRVKVPPRKLAALCLEFGTAQLNQGLVDEGADNVAYALELSRHAYDAHDETLSTMVGLADALAAMGRVHAIQGRIDDTYEALAESVRLSRRLVERSGPRHRAALHKRLTLLGDATLARNRHEEASRLYDEALWISPADDELPEGFTFSDLVMRQMKAGEAAAGIVRYVDAASSTDGEADPTAPVERCPLHSIPPGASDLAALRGLWTTLNAFPAVHSCRDIEVHAEAVRSARRLAASLGDTPLALGALWRALYHHAMLLVDSEPDTAIDTLGEAARVAESLHARVGDVPSVLLGLYTIYDRITDVPIWSRSAVDSVSGEVMTRAHEWMNRYLDVVNHRPGAFLRPGDRPPPPPLEIRYPKLRRRRLLRDLLRAVLRDLRHPQ